MSKYLKFKEGEETDLDTLMRNCGYGEKFDCMCNNGYTCHHPDNAGEYDTCKNKCGGCFAFQCPLAYQKNPEEDDKNCAWGDDTIMVLNSDLDAISQQSVQTNSHKEVYLESEPKGDSVLPCDAISRNHATEQDKLHINYSHHEKHGDTLTQQCRQGTASEEGKVSNSNDLASDDTLSIKEVQEDKSNE